MEYGEWLNQCSDDFRPLVAKALRHLNSDYLASLLANDDWLPGNEKLFAAFSMPLANVRFILLGESPYPRADSANGYAFWDNAVDSLWSAKGLSTKVNRATSLRHFIKMLLVARGDLTEDTTQQAIADVDKANLVQTGRDLFVGMQAKGIMLLNASLVYSKGRVPFHAKQWQPFIQSIVHSLACIHNNIQLILFGNFAKEMANSELAVGLCCEHPYNISFIQNEEVLTFFKPLDLLNHD